MATIHQFRHHAMATHFEARVADVDATYAAQAARAVFDRVDELEAQLSRFRPQSEIRRITALQSGDSLRLSAATFDCLTIAKKMEIATCGAFSATAAALQREPFTMPRWSLSPDEHSIRCEAGPVEFDLGAIGKGFALDCAADLLRLWECPSFCLVAGGSSVVAGDAPDGLEGWSCGVGDDDAPYRLLLTNASLSGSGLNAKGRHILDPHTGLPASRQSRAWALAGSAAESDALSTAAMVLTETKLNQILADQPTWLVLLEEKTHIRTTGIRRVPRAG